jgi:hypothetical protein
MCAWLCCAVVSRRLTVKATVHGCTRASVVRREFVASPSILAWIRGTLDSLPTSGATTVCAGVAREANTVEPLGRTIHYAVRVGWVAVVVTAHRSRHTARLANEIGRAVAAKRQVLVHARPTMFTWVRRAIVNDTSTRCPSSWYSTVKALLASAEEIVDSVRTDAPIHAGVAGALVVVNIAVVADPAVVARTVVFRQSRPRRSRDRMAETRSH